MKMRTVFFRVGKSTNPLDKKKHTLWTETNREIIRCFSFNNCLKRKKKHRFRCSLLPLVKQISWIFVLCWKQSNTQWIVNNNYFCSYWFHIGSTSRKRFDLIFFGFYFVFFYLFIADSWIWFFVSFISFDLSCKLKILLGLRWIIQNRVSKLREIFWKIKEAKRNFIRISFVYIKLKWIFGWMTLNLNAEWFRVFTIFIRKII